MDKVSLAVLQLLPELVELKLDLPRLSALGKHIFTRLLAKPGNQVAESLKFDWSCSETEQDGDALSAHP